MIVKKIIRKLIYMYQMTEEKEVKSRLGRCGEKARIYYPFTISHHELIRLGNDSVILPRCRMQVYPERTGITEGIQIGEGCFIGYDFCALAGESISIGDNVTIASKVCIVSENHSFDPLSKISYGEQALTVAPVRINDGCWIGEGAVILPGVTVGEKTVVGAGAVVTADVPPYCVVAGNPAKLIKKYDFTRKRWIKI